MTDPRSRRTEEIEKRLRGRKIVWVGTRGTDARPLLEFREFSACFSLIAPLQSMSVEQELCLETLTGRRVNLDAYDVDRDRAPEAVRLRKEIRTSLREPCVLVPYRPLRFLSTISFTEGSLVSYFGPFHERHSAFEHKPWVESHLKALGIPIIPWTHYTLDDPPRLAEALARGPLVMRLNRSSGGSGLRIVRSPADLEGALADDQEGFVSATPFLAGAVPLNVNACVFRDGSSALHAPSVQLIGVPECTTLPFGYCGNDFGLPRKFPTEILDTLEETMRRIASWLARMEYVGAFGVDLLLYRDRIFVSEINPRFQGSSDVSSRLDAVMELPDLYMDHLAAFLDLPAAPLPPLREMVQRHPPLSQILVHNLSPDPQTASLPPEDRGRSTVRRELVPSGATLLDPGAVRTRLVVPSSVTEDGRTLVPEFREMARLAR